MLVCPFDLHDINELHTIWCMRCYFDNKGPIFCMRDLPHQDFLL